MRKAKHWAVALAIGAAAMAAFPLGAYGAANPKGLVAFSDAGFEDIWTMNQDGSGVRNLTNNGTVIPEFDPAWHPNGKQILYTRTVANNEVWIMNADGSGQAPLVVTTGKNNYNASFSPDGTKIVFGSDRSGTGGGQDNEIWMVNADGSNPVRLTTNTANDNAPAFSPDGKQIAFLSSRHHAGPLNRRDVYVMNADGSNPVQLTFNSPATFTAAPHWSPDGKQISYPSGPNGDSEIFSIPSGGGTPTQLTVSGDDDRSPQYTMDGMKRIFFVSQRFGNLDRLFSMDSNGTLVGGPFGANVGLPGNGAVSPAPQPAAKCGKKVATIVGTDAAETLKGGPGPDVIVGFGGKDTIKGVGGKDRLCGDGGNDKISGGKGNDRLKGGAGNNRLNGGGGKKNVCIGGDGKNTATNCQKVKKISS